MNESKEDFVARMPVGWHSIRGGKSRYYSREEWEDFWVWFIRGRDFDPNLKAVADIIAQEINDE
jgi:hypothetical protein